MTSEKIPFFAVLIGINSYKTYNDLKPLRGAVHDALKFQTYLEGNLNVPSDQIMLLTDEDATRSNIIYALKQVKDDQRIDTGDAIFLYFAGHGAEIKPPKHREWASTKIQAIVPHDCDVVDKSGERVPPIPDYVLGFLLSEIAVAKGDNITVIFDCCHSGSGTRSGSSNQITRSVELRSSTAYLKKLDQELSDIETGSGGAYTRSELIGRGLGSHILLSACRATEKAYEENGRGLFSAALLKLLNNVSYHTLRYSDILTHPNFDTIPGQNPQCEGRHRSRTLFNAKILPAKRKSFRISFNNAENGPRQCVVHGGIIHNIAQDSEFAVYRMSDVTQSTKICVLHVNKLGAYSFTAKLSSDALKELILAHPAIAVQTNFGPQEHLRIYIPPSNGFHKIYDGFLTNSESKKIFDNISLVEKSEAQVEIELLDKNDKTEKDEVKFTLHTAIAVPNKVAIPQIVDGIEADPNHLAWIFPRIVHFYWELQHRNLNPTITSSVEVQFYKLKVERHPDPDKPNGDYTLTTEGPNLCIKGVVGLFVPDEPEEAKKLPYGLKLINRSNQILHANVFHFSSHDLEINDWATSYSGCTGDAVDGTPPGGTLEVGFGTAGYIPQTFLIKDGLDIDVGFLKIFLSTESVDLTDLPQTSPFSTFRSMTPFVFKSQQKAIPEVPWTDIIIPIILRRRR